jgi:phospholipid-binding lipoprotein MlaA
MLRYATVWFPFRFTQVVTGTVRAALVATIVLATVLATTLPSQAQINQRDEIDPWEGYNRWMFNFNDGADRMIIKPVARGYDFIMPEVARIGVNNFFTNFYDFNGALNALLQGEVEQAFNNTFRVLTNSTIGLFGLFDVASAVGIPRYETDFGHTLSIWGVPTGNYFVIPIVGPSTVRNAFGASIDAYISPTGQMMNDKAYWGLRAFNVVDFRASLLDAEEIMTGDRYVFYRDVYLQNRAVLESGGQVKDEFSEFDNDWDEDEF